jgi:hypothetical protein
MMKTMTTTRGNPMNFYLARGFYSLKKKHHSLSLLAPAERDEERGLETEREQNDSALLFFNSSLSSLSSSFSVMNSSSLQRNERNDRIFPSNSKKKIVRRESKKQGKNLKNKQQKKKAFRSLHTHTIHTHINKSENHARNDDDF